MIKTHSGEMIEARAGDIVRCSVAAQDGSTDVVLNCSEDVQAASGVGNYTLLHRPFQVGDEIFSIVDGCRETPDIYCDLNGVDSVKHRNPSWRNHPDWENSK